MPTTVGKSQRFVNLHTVQRVIIFLTQIDRKVYAFCIVQIFCNILWREEQDKKIPIRCVDSSTATQCCLIITRTITHMTKIPIPLPALHIFSFFVTYKRTTNVNQADKCHFPNSPRLTFVVRRQWIIRPIAYQFPDTFISMYLPPHPSSMIMIMTITMPMMMEDWKTEADAIRDNKINRLHSTTSSSWCWSFRISCCVCGIPSAAHRRHRSGKVKAWSGISDVRC